MKFCFSVQKMKLGDMAAAKRHNKRISKPSSQIEKKSFGLQLKGIIQWSSGVMIG